ncbi:MAG TPA: TlyA family rRNA (cytidine-2'-O)-methyltransferase [Desulfobacteraceae bacterium]|nr:TlyA family rRNA (cytidine-2'-O)-methyltransferase [Desulfobacteraceae bacterium]
MAKKRLDQIIVEKGLAQNRSRSRALIMAGKVFVNNRLADKPGIAVQENDDILLKGNDIPYVSRGGLKLAKAVDFFNINVNDLICMDVGASTGGFTDYLLQNGAEKIFAVDVGYGQFAWKLRQNPKVVVIERTNIRYMPIETVPVQIDLSVIDVSFISLKIVVPAVLQFMKKKGIIVALIKPQFEVGKGKVGKGGIVRDQTLVDNVIQDLTDFFTKIGLICSCAIPSPISGSKGNKEFLIMLNIQ